MTVTRLTIQLRDANSKINRDLTDFFRNNIEQIILRGGMCFSFKFADEDSPHKRFPVLEVPGQAAVVGVPAIKKFIQSRLSGGRPVARLKTDEEDLQDMFKNEMTNGLVVRGEGRIEIVEEQEREFDPNSMVRNAEAMTAQRSPEKQKGPSRRSVQDNPYEARAGGHGGQGRANNVAQMGVNGRDDPMSVLDNMSVGAGDERDQELMRTLMGRIDLNAGES